jgi:centromeric protein E
MGTGGGGGSTTSEEKISVSVRVRPLNEAEKDLGCAWRHAEDAIVLDNSRKETTSTSKESVVYRVDNVFDESCSNLDVYNKTTSKIVKSVLDGFNGTVFAYGQTSSGKTHTMHGEIGTEPGIVPLAVQDVFDSIEKCPEREFRVRVSYLEIYNENLLDLLARSSAEMDEHGQVSKTLRIQEDPERGIVVNGLKEERVQNVAQVQKVLEIGQNNRHVGATNMNARSSRSHVIFRLCIESKLRKDSELDSSDKSGHAKKPEGFVGTGTKSGSEKGGGDEDVANENVLVSVLNLVDLAGSERVAKTGAEGQRAKEGASINKSLLTLGVVINKLAEDGSKNGGAGGGHVPYRDSKLTRILQPALGGNSKTAIVCAMTPCVSHVEETSSTLRFATRAKNVTNQAKRNEVATATTALIKKQAAEIARLEKKLLSSTTLKTSATKRLEDEVEALKQALSVKDLKIQELEAKLSSSSSFPTTAEEVVDENQSASECRTVTTQNDNTEEGSKKQEQEMTPHTTEAVLALEAKLKEIQKEKDLVGEKMKTMKTEYKSETKKMFKRAEQAEKELEKLRTNVKKLKLENEAQNSDVVSAKEAIEAALVSRNLELASAVERATLAERKLEEFNRKLKLKVRSEDEDNFELNRKLENITDEKEELELTLQKKEKKFAEEKKKFALQVELAEKKVQESLKMYNTEGDGKIIKEMVEKIRGFEKDNVAKMNEIAKLKMELAQNVSKLIDYEYRLDEKTNNTTTSIPDIKNKSNKNTTEEVFMNEEIMKSRITELEEENADLQKRLMASPSENTTTILKKEEEELLKNDLRFALEEANVQIERMNVEVEKANAEASKANAERVDMEQMLEDAVVAVEEQARLREALEKTLEEIENKTMRIVSAQPSSSPSKKVEANEEEEKKKIEEIKKLCTIYEIKYGKAKERMKEDLVRIKALTKEISNEKKKREGLKYEVVKLTKQMDKMQTVYGRLKSTKYSGNEEAFEKAREACEKEVENDLVSKKNLKKDRRQEVTPLAENNNN